MHLDMTLLSSVSSSHYDGRSKIVHPLVALFYYAMRPLKEKIPFLVLDGPLPYDDVTPQSQLWCIHQCQSAF